MVNLLIEFSSPVIFCWTSAFHLQNVKNCVNWKKKCCLTFSAVLETVSSLLAYARRKVPNFPYAGLIKSLIS